VRTETASAERQWIPCKGYV